MLEIWNLEKYDEEFFTNFFDVTNKIEIEKIHIQLSLRNEDEKKICAKIHEKIRTLETQNITSNEVSCFI